MLDISKDDYKASEMRKYNFAKILIAVQFIYEMVKVTLLTISYTECDKDNDAECTRVIHKNVSWFLVSDMIEAGIILLWIIYQAILLFIVMKKYSRLEYEKHKVPMCFNFLGLLISLPLVMCGKYFWLVDFCTYLVLQVPYYLMFFSGVLPAMGYIFARIDHDCFNCFNRITPSRYSIF